MAKGRNIVTKGRYLNKPVIQFGKKIVILTSLISKGQNSRVVLDETTVEKWEELHSQTSTGVKRSIIGGALFGRAGAIIGATTAKTNKYLVKITYKGKDEGYSVLELDGRTYEHLVTAIS